MERERKATAEIIARAVIAVGATLMAAGSFWFGVRYFNTWYEIVWAVISTGVWVLVTLTIIKQYNLINPNNERK